MSTTNLHHRVIFASELVKGDIITNRGVVDAVTRSGVFVIVAVRGTTWSLAIGKGDIHVHDLVLHEAENVTVDAWEEA